MDLRKQLLRLLGANDYEPLRRMEIVSVLGLDTDAAIEALHSDLDSMLKSGEVIHTKKDRLAIPENAPILSGVIRFRASGSAILIPDANPNADGLKIRSEDTGVALHGDTVVAKRKRGKKRAANRPSITKKCQSSRDSASDKLEVIRVVKRARTTLSGILKVGKDATYVLPDDPRITQRIHVQPLDSVDLQLKPKPGDKVLVELFEWRHRHRAPEGTIIEVIGETHEPDAEFKAILLKYNLEADFPKQVLAHTDTLPNRVAEEDARGRQDHRDVFTFTIDPDDAKDFDDALSVEVLPDGKKRIGIHIADVSAYVKPNTALDREAQKRGNSTYLVGTVIPMLPHALSNGLCSLVEGEDRLTKSCFITFTPTAEVLEVTFANTVICSNKRLTYRQALAFMEGDDFKSIRATPLPPKHQTGSTGRPLASLDDEEMRTLKNDIDALWAIGKQLRERRFRKGSLDLEMTEVKLYVDADGYTDRIEKQSHDISHQVIEEFMLAANEQIARLMKRENFPCVYRVHDEPEDEKLRELRETMLSFGVQCGNLSKSREMALLLARLKDHPQGYTLKVHVLRSLKQAQYRSSPDGHYGLAKPDYTHFTSPIRRYADLLVHRVLDAYLCKVKAPSALDSPDIRYQAKQLDSLADHISITERNSIEAERESVKTKLLEYYERILESGASKPLRATITDLKPHGLFIELTDSLAFGMIHVSMLDDDYYELDESASAFTGRRKGRNLALGQELLVELTSVDRFKRQMDFRLAQTDPRDLDKPRGRPFKRRSKHSRSKQGETLRRSDGKAILYKRPKKRRQNKKD